MLVIILCCLLIGCSSGPTMPEFRRLEGKVDSLNNQMVYKSNSWYYTVTLSSSMFYNNSWNISYSWAPENQEKWIKTAYFKMPGTTNWMSEAGLDEFINVLFSGKLTPSLVWVYDGSGVIIIDVDKVLLGWQVMFVFSD